MSLVGFLPAHHGEPGFGSPFYPRRPCNSMAYGWIKWHVVLSWPAAAVEHHGVAWVPPDWMIGSFPPNPQGLLFWDDIICLGDIYPNWFMSNGCLCFGSLLWDPKFRGIKLDLYAHVMAPVNEPTRIQ